MKIKRKWLIASAVWGCLVLGLLLYSYGNRAAAVLFDLGFVLCFDLLLLIPWLTRRVRRARGLPYKPSWWLRFAIDSDYGDSQRDKCRLQTHSR